MLNGSDKDGDNAISLPSLQSVLGDFVEAGKVSCCAVEEFQQMLSLPLTCDERRRLDGVFRYSADPSSNLHLIHEVLYHQGRIRPEYQHLEVEIPTLPTPPHASSESFSTDDASIRSDAKRSVGTELALTRRKFITRFVVGGAVSGAATVHLFPQETIDVLSATQRALTALKQDFFRSPEFGDCRTILQMFPDDFEDSTVQKIGETIEPAQLCFLVSMPRSVPDYLEALQRTLGSTRELHEQHVSDQSSQIPTEVQSNPTEAISHVFKFCPKNIYFSRMEDASNLKNAIDDIYSNDQLVGYNTNLREAGAIDRTEESRLVKRHSMSMQILSDALFGKHTKDMLIRSGTSLILPNTREYKLGSLDQRPYSDHQEPMVLSEEVVKLAERCTVDRKVFSILCAPEQLEECRESLLHMPDMAVILICGKQ